MGTAFARFLALAALWLMLIDSVKPGDLAMGAVTAAAATWISLRLLPPDGGRIRFAALLALLPRFLWQSIVAGIDVARRAFDPRLPLATGFVRHRTGFPRGPARCAFSTITSLLPGTVPARDDADGIEYHCLDTSQPVAEELADEERRYARAIEAGRRDG
jgi:multicomponent Na+:H+ antiporter subunit E